MKKILNIIVCVVVLISTSSCDYFKEKKYSQDTGNNATAVEGISHELKNKIAAQDTLMNALVSQVDTLVGELNQIKQDNANLKAQIDGLKNPKSTWGYVSMVALLLGLIAIVLSLFRAKGVKEEKVYRISEKCIDDSRKIKELQVKLKTFLQQQNVHSSTSNTFYAHSTDSRLQQLENKMSQVFEAINKMTTSSQYKTQPHSETLKPNKDGEYQKIGYAKVDTEKYFTTIFDSNQEGCVFKITFTNSTRGKFNIIALEKIQSRNDWQKKVECSGVSIKEASDFRLEDEGICEKIDENTWEVTKPLKIRLLK